MTILVRDTGGWKIALWVLVGVAAMVLALGLALRAVGQEDPPPPTDEPISVLVVSPWDGVFRAGEYPGSTPYVQPGDTVAPHTTVCGIETMMQVFEVRAEVSGRVTEVLVQDGEFVEMGQPLVRIEMILDPGPIDPMN